MSFKNNYRVRKRESESMATLAELPFQFPIECMNVHMKKPSPSPSTVLSPSSFTHFKTPLQFASYYY
jgi:hypothetical protein